MISISSPQPNATFKNTDVIAVSGDGGPLQKLETFPVGGGLAGGAAGGGGASLVNPWNGNVGPLAAGDWSIKATGTDASVAAVEVTVTT